jgi:hypothetical protein
MPMPLADESRTGRVLHERLLAGEPTAFDEILVRYYEYLVAQLGWFVRSRNLDRVADEDTRRDAAVDAFESYRKVPARYDPAKGKTLGGFLRMAAEGDLKNRLSKQRPPDQLRLVGLEDEDWNRVIADDPAVEDDVSAQVDAEALYEEALALAEDREERIVAQLWWLGEERRTAVYAVALSIGQLDPGEQAAYVQRIKDRLDQRRRRRFRGGRGDEPAR